MNSCLIIPDIHHRTCSADWTIKKHPECEKIIFLGDFFDDFGDNANEAMKTARWIKNTQEKLGDKAIWLYGNHDLNYAFPLSPYCGSFGHTKEKGDAVKAILKPENWAKFKLLHIEQGFWISHAGLHQDIFRHPLMGWHLQTIEKQLADGLEALRHGIMAPCLAGGRSRGFQQSTGGIVWLDWTELPRIPGMNQIVGHTPHKFPQVNHWEDCINYCLDTNSQHYGILENNILTIEENPAILKNH